MVLVSGTDIVVVPEIIVINWRCCISGEVVTGILIGLVSGIEVVVTELVLVSDVVVPKIVDILTIVVVPEMLVVKL